MGKVSARWSLLFFIADAAVVWLSSVLAAIGLQTYAGMDWLWPLPSGYLLATTVALLLLPMFCGMAGRYRVWHGTSLAVEIRVIALAWSLVMLLIIVVGYVTKTGTWFSRPWMAAWFFTTFALLVSNRVLIRGLLRDLHRRGIDTKSVVLVGGEKLGKFVARSILDRPSSGLVLSGYFADLDEGAIAPGCPYLGNLSEVAGYLQGRPTDQLWLTMPFRFETEIRNLLYELRHCTIDVRMIPDIFGYQLLNYSVEQVVGLPVLNLSASPQQGLDAIFKGLLDRVLAVLMLLMLTPLLLLLALGIRTTSPGPVLFRQLRHGWDGAPIMVYKFRSMRLHATEAGSYRQATANDDRVTPLGRWLRRTSFDELPQLLNVVQGSMSLVGPRPHPVEMNERYKDQVDKYMLRHKVKPGITGWAQVNGLRGETNSIDKLQRRIEHDLYYIEHWSLSFDLKILLLTVPAVLNGFVRREAY